MVNSLDQNGESRCLFRRQSVWRGSLLPLGGEAALKSVTAVLQIEANRWFCDCCTVEREQAPSPQGSMFGHKKWGVAHTGSSRKLLSHNGLTSSRSLNTPASQNRS